MGKRLGKCGTGAYRSAARTPIAALAACVALLGLPAYAAAESGPPVNTSLPTFTGTTKEGGTLKGREGNWTGEKPIEITYRWEDCEDTEISSCSPNGGSSKSYEVLSSDVGLLIRLTVIARNKAGEGTESSRMSEPVEGTRPTNTKLPSISTSEPRQGELLTAEAGEWVGTPVTGFKYEWERCSTKCEVVAEDDTASTKSTYRAISGQGDTLRVQVTATNPAGSRSATSAATETIKAGPPVLGDGPGEGPTIIGEAHEGRALTVSNGTWYGTPPITFTYLWWSCTALQVCIPAGTDASFTPGPDEATDTIEVTVTASNSVEPPASATSPAVGPVVGNPPKEEEPPEITGQAREGQPLTASAGSWSGAQPFTFTYSWEACSAAECAAIVGAGSGSTYVVGEGLNGKTIRVTVTASNSVEPPASATSPAVGPVQVPPKNEEPPTISGKKLEGGTLEASAGRWSGTPPFTFTYSWEACSAAECAAILGAGSGSTYVVGEGLNGKTIRVTVTASNSVEPPASATSPAVGPVEVPPKNEEPPTISGTALEGEELEASTGRWSGMEPSYSYQWERCDAGGACRSIPEATQESYTVARSEIGETIRVTVTATNSGAREGMPASSAQSARVQANGEAVAWGENFHGQLGQIYRDNWELRPVPVMGVDGITQLAAGGSDDYALLNNGELVAWGGNASGQNGDDETLAAWEAGSSHVTVDEFEDENTSEPVQLKGVKQVAAADNRGLALMDGGTVKAWGSNEAGDLGNGSSGLERDDLENESAARTVRWTTDGKAEELTKIAAVAAGGRADYAVTEEEGAVWAWGGDVYGQLGKLPPGEEPERCAIAGPGGHGEACDKIPRKVWWENPATGKDEELKHVKAVHAGEFAAYALLEDGEVLAWGSNTARELGNTEDTGTRIAPTYVDVRGGGHLQHVVELAAGTYNAVARLENGEIFGWGLAEGGALTISQPEATQFKPGEEYAEDNCGRGELTEQERTQKEKKLSREIGRVEGELHEAEEKQEEPQIKELDKKRRQFEATLEEVREGFQVKFCLSRATQLPRLEHLGTAGLDAEQLSLGNNYGLALAAGKVFAWGSNTRGQQGNGEEPGGIELRGGTGETTFQEYATPAAVTGFGTAVAVVAGTESHATVVLAAHAEMPEPLLTAEPVRFEEPAMRQLVPAMQLAWSHAIEEEGTEGDSLRGFSYRRSRFKGEPPVVEPGASNEGQVESLVPPFIELEEEPLEEQPVEGERLIATTGEWAGAIAPPFEYRWRRCGPTGEQCQELERWQLEGKTKERFEVTAEEATQLKEEKAGEWIKWGAGVPGHTVVAADVGHALRVEVVAHGTGGERVGAVSDATGEVLTKAEAGGGGGSEKISKLACGCTSPLVIDKTHQKTGKTVTEDWLVAEPYEVKAKTEEPDGKDKRRIMVVLPFGKPAITSQPANANVQAGEEALFHVTASGGPKPSVEWEESANGGATWSVVSGESSMVLIIAHAAVSESGDEYRAVFSNEEGQATSDPATLTVTGSG